MRVLVYDRTCVTRGRGLSLPWAAGARMYRAMGRIDRAKGVASWGEAFAWLGAQLRRIDELHYWGHGHWGQALVGGESFDAGALRRGHPLHDPLRKVRFAPGALVWFRTCETVGAARGIAFAEALADHLGARVAGHTFVIGWHQSGLHGVAPGARADWSADEGLAEGTAADPKRAHWSTKTAPRTITCLDGSIPDAWIAR